MIRIKSETEIRDKKLKVKITASYEDKVCTIEKEYDLYSEKISEGYLSFLVNKTIDEHINEIKEKLNASNRGVLIE